MGLIHKSFHEKTCFQYCQLKQHFGVKQFHIYNILNSKATPEKIIELTALLQKLKWDGLLLVAKQKARVRVRGKTRWINKYQFV